MRGRAGTISMGAVALSIGLPSLALAATPEQPVVTVDDVVVTAQRREERLQDVPITIAAYDESVLKAQSIRDSLDLAKLTPGVIINKNIGAAIPWIRAVGTITSGFGTELPIATYLDGFYLATPAAGVFSLNNIQRVEILKGPQGTLFGRNASGGVVQVVTKDPGVEEIFDASLGYGAHQTLSGDVYASTAISDTLAASLALTGSHQGEGWGRNRFTGSEAFKTEQWGGQLKGRWTPDDQTTVTLQALYDQRISDVGIAIGIYPGAFGVDGTPFYGPYDIASRRDRVGKANQSLLGLKVERDLGFATLVSLTGYNRVHSAFSVTQSGLPGRPAPGQSAVEVELAARARTFTQEIQLFSPSGSRLSWIAGAFYLQDRQAQNQVVHGTCVGSTCSGSVPVLIGGRQTSASYAAFGQATFEIVENLRLTGGLRYTRDEKDIGDGFARPAPGYPNTPVVLPATQLARPGLAYAGNPAGIPTSDSWEKLTWRASLDYRFSEEVMGYVSANRGFKSGTYNIVAFTNPPARPEVLDAYEVGVKSTLLDNTLRLNASAYYYDYQDIQLRTTAPPAPVGQTILFNAAQSTIKGLDIDAQYAIASGWLLHGGLALIDAQYEKFPGGTCVRPAVRTATVLGGNVSASCDRSGARMIRAPKLAGTLGFSYRRQTEIGEISATAADTYTSSFFWEPSNRIKQEAYHNISASLTWTSPDGRYDLQIWGKNLADAFYYTAAFEGANDTYSPGEPRTFGVRAGVHF